MSFDLPPATGWEGGDHMPRGLDALWAKLRGIEDRLDAMTGANLLSTAGVRPGPGLLRIIGSLLIEGNLAVPNGSITNDALASQVAPGYSTNAQTGFGLSTSYQSLAVAPLVVPDKMTSAILIVYGSVLVANAAGAGSDWLWIEAGLAGDTNGGMPTLVGDGAWATEKIVGVLTRTGLSGGQVLNTAVRAYGQGHGWPVNAGNRAYTRAVGLFFR